ncbi:hypothetical protein ACWEGV_38190, partial [Streptomyces sp. NPDC004976]
DDVLLEAFSRFSDHVVTLFEQHLSAAATPDQVAGRGRRAPGTAAEYDGGLRPYVPARVRAPRACAREYGTSGWSA